MADLENIKKYKKTELLSSSPEELYVKMVETVVRDLKMASAALAAKNDDEFYDSIIKACEMWGLLVDMLFSIDTKGDKGLKDLKIIYISVERELTKISMNKDYETLQIVIQTTEIVKKMWQKPLENGG